jgi:hypothetical protein
MTEEPKPQLLVSPGTGAPAAPPATRPLWLAFLASAVVALLGGLLWAGISIATGYNLGFLALIIGAFTGLTARRVAGTEIGGFERGLSGLFAAGAIIVGNYVIFVHSVKDALAKLHAPPGVSAGYFNGAEISEFTHHFGTYVHGFDWFWIALAAYAAIRTSGGRVVMGIGRARS